MPPEATSDIEPHQQLVRVDELERLRNYKKAFELAWPVLKTIPQPADFWWELHQLAGVLARPDSKEQS